MPFLFKKPLHQYDLIWMDEAIFVDKPINYVIDSLNALKGLIKKYDIVNL
jgi:hypothetical protein